MPQQHSTIGGHLTITSPKPEDMRLEPSLNVMPEGSLGDLPMLSMQKKLGKENIRFLRKEHKEPLLKL